MPPLLKTILLAEDSEDDEKLFLRTLRQSGVANPVSVVRDGDEAIAYLNGNGAFANRQQFPLPGALFLDLKMRRVDGWEVLTWVRGQDNLQNLLVVVLTVFDEPKAIMDAYRLGAHSFLVKPLSHHDVQNLVRHFGSSLSYTSRNEAGLAESARLISNFKR